MVRVLLCLIKALTCQYFERQWNGTERALVSRVWTVDYEQLIPPEGFVYRPMCVIYVTNGHRCNDLYSVFLIMIRIKTAIHWVPLYAKHWAKHWKYCISKTHNNLLRSVLLCPLYRWGKGSSENWSYLPKLSQDKVNAGSETQSICHSPASVLLL